MERCRTFKDFVLYPFCSSKSLKTFRAGNGMTRFAFKKDYFGCRMKTVLKGMREDRNGKTTVDIYMIEDSILDQDGGGIDRKKWMDSKDT